MDGVHTILVDSNKKFSALVKRPEKLLLKEHDLIDRTKLLTKVIYDVSKLLEPSPCLKTLPELIVDGFDCEQVNLSLDTKSTWILGCLKKTKNIFFVMQLNPLIFMG